MRLTHAKKQTLRGLGWSVTRRKAKRPPDITARDTLQVGEDVRTDGVRLVQLDANL